MRAKRATLIYRAFWDSNFYVIYCMLFVLSGKVDELQSHSVLNHSKKSHKKLRRKRATSTFCVDKKFISVF